jgi:hypothetical protein
MVLKSSPSTFQGLMNFVVRGIRDVRAPINQNDKITYYRTLNEHNVRLTEIFERLREENL